MIKTPAIGVAFNIDRLGSDYPTAAWERFLPHVEPGFLAGTEIRDGDTNETLLGQANHFCIAVAGSEKAVRHVRQVFAALDLPELLPAAERLLDEGRLRDQPLPLRATVDPQGRLITHQWEQPFHRLCVAARWPYHPKQIPDDLDPATRAEIEKLNEPRAVAKRMAEAAAVAQPPGPEKPAETPATQPPAAAPARRWWRFWKS